MPTAPTCTSDTRCKYPLASTMKDSTTAGTGISSVTLLHSTAFAMAKTTRWPLLLAFPTAVQLFQLQCQPTALDLTEQATPFQKRAPLESNKRPRKHHVSLSRKRPAAGALMARCVCRATRARAHSGIALPRLARRRTGCLPARQTAGARHDIGLLWLPALGVRRRRTSSCRVLALREAPAAGTALQLRGRRMRVALTGCALLFLLRSTDARARPGRSRWIK